MPLGLLLVLVVTGIAGIAVLLHVMGKSELKTLDTDSARAAWLRNFPTDQVHQVLLARDGHAALISSAQGIGLVWAFGDDTVARQLTDFEILEHASGLRLRLHEFTAPAVTLRLDPDERQNWQEVLKYP